MYCLLCLTVPASSIQDYLLLPCMLCRHLTMGRIIIIVLAVAGLLPLLGDAKALDATTVSGTIILGLGPPIFALMWVDGYRPLTFHLPFWW